MQYLTEKRFSRKLAVTALLLCVLPQLFSAVAEYLYIYFTQNAGISETANVILAFVFEFLRTSSLFSSYAIIAYMVFIKGLGGGGEWLLCEITATALILFIVYSIGDLAVALIASAVTAIVLGAILFFWVRSCRGTLIILYAALIIPFFSGISQLYIQYGTAPGIDELFLNLFYSMIDRCVNIILLTAAARIAFMFRSRALEKEGVCDIAVNGKFLPNGNPMIKAVLGIDIMFLIYALLQGIIEIVSEINSYGSTPDSGELFTLLMNVIIPVIYFAIGYLLMWLVTCRIETLFIRSEEETDIITRQRKRS